VPKNPLVEVFGYPVDNLSPEADSHRSGRLCPFHNSSGLNCTKNSAIDPLGVCTVADGNKIAITCPIRLRQDLLIVSDAAGFFFSGNTRYLALTEVRLNDKQGKSAGNIDIIIAALDEQGHITDFGALEIQAVYISGNVSKAFNAYMQAPHEQYSMSWPSKNYPSPDYLSSSRKRLVPQLIYKGGILNHWRKKLAVAVHESFFEQLPPLPEVDESQAEIAWFIYRLVHDDRENRYRLVRVAVKYTRFQEALNAVTIAEPGEVATFMKTLTERIKRGKVMGSPSAAIVSPTLAPLPDFDEEDPDSENAFQSDDSAL
jgi:hypothetical protein